MPINEYMQQLVVLFFNLCNMPLQDLFRIAVKPLRGFFPPPQWLLDAIREFWYCWKDLSEKGKLTCETIDKKLKIVYWALTVLDWICYANKGEQMEKENLHTKNHR